MEEIRNLIRSVPDFPRKGIVFRDISPLLKDPIRLAGVISKIRWNWAGKMDVIAALDARGFIFGSMLAFAMGIPFVMMRKKGKLPGNTLSVSYGLEYGKAELEIEASAFDKGSRVLIVDDLLATGGTAAAACALVEKAGASVAGCAFVVELRDLGGRETLSGREIQTIIHFDKENS